MPTISECLNCKREYDIDKYGPIFFCSLECYEFYTLTKDIRHEVNALVNGEITKMSQTITQQDLMIQYFNDEQLKIDTLPWDTNPDEAYRLLSERIIQVEAIAFESKARASRLTRKKREIDAASGKERFNKGTNLASLADPRVKNIKPDKVKAKDASKLEKIVMGMVSLEYTDDDIMDGIPGTKYNRAEVWEAIKTVRGDKERKLTPEQEAGMKSEAEGK